MSQLMLRSHRNQAQIVLQNMPATENALVRELLSLISLRERGSSLKCFVFMCCISTLQYQQSHLVMLMIWVVPIEPRFAIYL